MAAIEDFEDMLVCLKKHEVRYVIVGGMAFIYHAKPRYTKDMDIWIEPTPRNIKAANAALTEFGSPTLLDESQLDHIVQIGVAPNRIDLLLTLEHVTFEQAWTARIRGAYGQASANWMDLDSLLTVKENIQHPRHQEDARTLRKVKERQQAKA